MALTEVDAARLNDNVFNAVGPFTNRIINGDMRIDQRNAGASVTPSVYAYTVDRWAISMSQGSKFAVGQNAGSVTLPAGFTNYLGATSQSAYSVTSGDYFTLQQNVEGFNISDLAWGTANAKPITISFWVQSSLTGLFGGSINNSGSTRNYPFSYTIFSANTWEFKTLTISGDTSGTWLTTNGVGLTVNFALGMGSTYSGTAGAWTGTGYYSATGATSVVGTNGATFYITGVQLEAGSVATPFERRSYGQELSLCQRYCYAVRASEGGDPYTRYALGDCLSIASHEAFLYLPVEMRTRPTSLTTTGTASNYAVYSAGSIVANSAVPVIMIASTTKVVGLQSINAGSLTAGRAGQLLANNNTTSYLIISAEL